MDAPSDVSAHDATKPPTDEWERGWKDYSHLSGLFQFYVGLVLKAFTAALSISGAIVTFVVSQPPGNSRIASGGFVLAALLCAGIGSAFLGGVPAAIELRNALKALKVRLKLELAPHAGNLVTMIVLFGMILEFSAIALLTLFLAQAFFGWSGQIGAVPPALPISTH